MNPTRRIAPIALVLLAASCSELKQDLGLTVDLTGRVAVDGTEPGAVALALYAWGDNQKAFDASFCGGETDSDCLGRVDVGALDKPVKDTEVTWNGLEFTMSNVPADLLYVLVVRGDDDAVDCSQDIVGFDEETKVVTKTSAIAIEADGDVSEVELPRPARISCSAPLAEPTPPEDPIPSEEPTDPESETPEGDITVPPGVDPVASWTLFQVSNLSGPPNTSDATDGSVASSLVCDSNFPAKLQIQATSTDTTAKEAYLRIQFGTGDDAKVQTTAMPMSNGVVHQLFALTGGYAVVQLDLNPELDGVSESHTITFCDRDDPPAQELMAILTWDKDDTDVDLHIESDHDEVAYYSLHRPWGDLDIDDIDGFGPETFTAAPGQNGRQYTVWAHHYSDHGNGKTTATVRVIYVDPVLGTTCDISASHELPSYAWYRVGKFGSGLRCQ